MGLWFMEYVRCMIWKLCFLLGPSSPPNFCGRVIYKRGGTLLKNSKTPVVNSCGALLVAGGPPLTVHHTNNTNLLHHRRNTSLRTVLSIRIEDKHEKSFIIFRCSVLSTEQTFHVNIAEVPVNLRFVVWDLLL
jgi:hypothetical protein